MFFYRTPYWPVILFFICYLAFLLLVGRYYWIRFKKNNPQLNFNYRITDIWAATLACTPSFLLLKFALDTFDTSLLAMFVAVLLGQVAGLMIGRVHIEIPPHQGAKNAVESAISIVAGALVGILMLFVFSILYAIFIVRI